MTGKVEDSGLVANSLRLFSAIALMICLMVSSSTVAVAQDESPATDKVEAAAEEAVEATVEEASGDGAETATEEAAAGDDSEAAETAEDPEDEATQEETATDEPEADADEPAEESTETEPVDGKDEAPAEDTEEIEPPTAESDEAETDSAEGAPTSGESPESGASDTAGDADADSMTEGLILTAIIIALFLVPMFLGNVLSKKLRMPDHGWKFSLAIGTLAAAAVVFAFGEVKLGPDLSGGITLIYELQDAALRVEDDGDEDGQDEVDATGSEKDELVDKLIAALTKRVDPSGTKEVSIRKYGAGQIEIIIPYANEEDREFIERKIYTAGSLEFRIVASKNFASHKNISEEALRLPKGVNELLDNGEKVAEWVSYDLDKFGPVDGGDPEVIKRMAGKVAQILILTDDGQDVKGDDLTNVQSTFGQAGGAIVTFNFNSQGAFKFERLTGDHLPTPAGDYRLGILLDNQLISAPSIEGKISYNGQINGLSGEEEAKFLAGILQAGALPAKLNKEPIFRETISPTLGLKTIEQGKLAISISLAAVMVFMLFYYRFAGFVACLALASNLLLILGLMVLFKAAFTLPGLAGLVLTIGMSVDANVLIFERIREERSRGAAMRMAIINGFARATQTIVDANVTTLITAIVIYRIAPDNVKGFGVTLILGIVMSMYSAIFLSRLVFDICEKTRSLTELKMAQIVKGTKIDFLGKRVIAGICSLIVIGIGLTAVTNRGEDLLNIDFTGGSSVTMVFEDDQPMNFADVKSTLDETELADKNLSLVEVGEQDTGLRYTVKSVDEDIVAVQALLKDTFGERLKTYSLEISDVQAIPAAPAQDDAAEGEEGEDSETPEISDPYAGGTSALLSFGGEETAADPNAEEAVSSGVGYETISQMLSDALELTEHSGAAWQVTNEDYEVGSVRRYPDWEVKLALPTDEAAEVWEQMKSVTNNQPIFPLANAIGGRVAGDLSSKAIAAVLTSLLGIIAYIWFRFQRMIYGFAAVIALVHDVLVTLGFIALSAVVVQNIPGLAEALLIEKFQISLPIVAAFLTIIGYSLNDTIVVFDRIREVKGKSPDLTADMINTSINQTLARTLLTSATTLLSVILLYTLGGDGIHGFAFALVIGVIVGTYSSIFIASPSLLWMSQFGQSKETSPKGSKAA